MMRQEEEEEEEELAPFLLLPRASFPSPFSPSRSADLAEKLPDADGRRLADHVVVRPRAPQVVGEDVVGPRADPAPALPAGVQQPGLVGVAPDPFGRVVAVEGELREEAGEEAGVEGGGGVGGLWARRRRRRRSSAAAFVVLSSSSSLSSSSLVVRLVVRGRRGKQRPRRDAGREPDLGPVLGEAVRQGVGCGVGERTATATRGRSRSSSFASRRRFRFRFRFFRSRLYCSCSCFCSSPPPVELPDAPGQRAEPAEHPVTCLPHEPVRV